MGHRKYLIKNKIFTVCRLFGMHCIIEEQKKKKSCSRIKNLEKLYSRIFSIYKKFKKKCENNKVKREMQGKFIASKVCQ